MDAQNWLFFLFASLALNLTPGPDLLFVTSTAAANGRRAGAMAALGIATGAMIHVGAAAIGLSAMLAASSVAFSIIKWAGAAYLLYLGLSAIRSSGSIMLGSKGSRLSPQAAFRQGMFVDVINPKPAIFFLAFLPQFVVSANGHIAVQLGMLGTAVVVVGLAVELVAVMAAAHLTNALRRHPRVAARLDRALGVVFIGLAGRLAFEQRP